MKLISIFLVIVFSLIVGCSGSTKDVRLTLCEDLTALSLKSSDQFKWVSNDIVIDGYEDLEVKLKYVSEHGDGSSSCFYPYDATDEDAMTHSNPASAYSTYPSKFLLNGNKINNKVLAATVNSAILKQGKEFLSQDSLK